MKKILSLTVALLMLFMFSSCKNDENDVETTVLEETGETGEAVEAVANEALTENFTVSEDSVSEEAAKETSSEPSEWTREQVVKAYTDAAKKSDPTAKSDQVIKLLSISVNNGEYEGLFNFITPIMSKLLSNNSKQKDGITGGFTALVPEDAVTAKAYKSGNDTVIEMVMKNQTSGARDNELQGSVGHAITAVGDITFVTNQLKDLGLPLELSEKDTKIYYTKPTVKVRINENGEIVCGTWQYTVEISMNNYKAFGKSVDTTSVIMDNIVTVNGGFNL